jgi:hypothetical protein
MPKSVTNDKFNLEHWAKDRKIKLMKEDCDVKRHHFYLSSEQGETFQIVIESEHENTRRIDAHLIETSTNEDAHFIWEVSECQFKNALDMALGTSHAWFQRGVR